MTKKYEIQGRILERAGRKVVRDEVRLAVAETLDDAVRSAQAFVADGFTAWIFAVEPGSQTTPVYRLLDTLRPAPSQPSPRQTAAAFRAGLRSVA